MANLKMENQSFLFYFKHLKNLALKVELIGDAWIWHRRLGNLNFHNLKLFSQKNMVHRLPKIKDKHEVCERCALGKHHRKPFPKGVAWILKKPLELVHTDLCEPMQTPSHAQNIYFILFIDDFTRMTWVSFMRQKSDVFIVFKEFKMLVEK